jgi:hypothetical protein
MAGGLLSLQQKWLPDNIFRGGGHKADNLTAIYEPIVWAVYDPRRLTPQWVSTAYYRGRSVAAFACTPCVKRLLTYFRGNMKTSATFIDLFNIRLH